MERAVALKKLTKIIGKSLAYRINSKAPSAEERDAAKAELPSAIAARNKLKEQRDARHKAILEADAEYQALQAAFRAARDRADTLSGMTYSYKITVGSTSSGIFFSVMAEGDTWEEILDKLAKKEAA